MDRPQTELAAVQKAKRGDVEAYATIVRSYQRLAFRAAYLVTRNAADAEEAVQDAFVKAWRAIGRFDGRRPLRPWLLSIVINEARNRRRSAARHEAIAVRAAEQASGDAVPSPEEVVPGELSARMIDAIERLPEKQRLVVMARYFLDLSETDTATVLQLRPGTVKSRLSRALDRLRREVER